jgi:hypothetical protein
MPAHGAALVGMLVPVGMLAALRQDSPDVVLPVLHYVQQQ